LPEINLFKISTFLAYASLIASVPFIAPEVPFSLMILFGCALILGLFLDRGEIQTWRTFRLGLVILVILGIVISFIGINDDNFFQRMLGILLIIISAKLIGHKKNRDILQIFLLNLLVVAAGAVTRWGIEIGLLVILETFISISGLIFLYGAGEQRNIAVSHARHLIRWSGMITAGMIPLTVILFLIIPRPTGTFFVWGGKDAARTGFSDNVSPGTVEEIKMDSAPAFRVKWLKGTRPPRPLWRGIVYDTYQLGVWENRLRDKIDTPLLKGDIVRYEVLLEPHDSRYLLSYGLPLRIFSKSFNPSVITGYAIQVLKNLHQRALYRVTAYAFQHFPADLGPDLYLDIPDALSEKIRYLAQERAGDTTLNTARAIESYLRTQFTYDLSPGEARGDPTLFFLFNSKKGHCEYFASSMVLMLRALGIPARMIGGYLGGQWNALGQYYLVRQSDAHTWVEAWIDGEGWVTFDPTPAVPAQAEMPLKAKMGRFIDFIKMKWAYWVLDYDLDRQLAFARRTRDLFTNLKAGDYEMDFQLKGISAKTFIPVISVIVLAIGFVFLKPHLTRRPGSWGERFVFLLQKHGHVKKTGETLQEFARRIAGDNNPAGRKMIRFVEQDYLWDYGNQGKEETLKQLLGELKHALKRGNGGKGKRRNGGTGERNWAGVKRQPGAK